MNENENNFEPLRRLLAFKNRETPPPGYFNNFSSSVIARIRAGESGAVEDPFAQAPWILRLIQAFQFKPAFAGTFAGALCLLLVFGIVYAERPDAAPQPLLPSAAAISPQMAMASPANFQPTETSGLIASTNPVIFGSAAALFNQPSQLAQEVSFTVPGN
jgi:hypothetical protein